MGATARLTFGFGYATAAVLRSAAPAALACNKGGALFGWPEGGVGWGGVGRQVKSLATSAAAQPSVSVVNTRALRARA